ncbi:MAG TPA: glycosyltransferase family 4 protein [Thermoanaerobaculia bacterium]
MDRPIRLAFLTPDFPTESRSGAGAFVHRFAEVLRQYGQTPEVFVSSDHPPGAIDFYGLRVERVPSRHGVVARQLRRLSGCGELVDNLVAARELARAVERRHAEQPFDIIHATDWRATGLFTRRIPKAVRVAYCCWSRELFRRSERRPWSFAEWALDRLEVLSVRRADRAYAPSRYLAGHLERSEGIDTAVVRTPHRLECVPVDPRIDLPERYLLHFGHLRLRKGTDMVAAALPLAWKEEPELRMVWAGPLRGVSFDQARQSWGAYAGNVIHLDELERAELYGVLHRSVAAVLPSRSDNLPNTAIESLMLGVPVIGTFDSSIDELVEPGVCGDLVAIDDVSGLAAAMVRAWRGEVAFHRLPAVFTEMQAENAVRRLLEICGFPPVRLERQAPLAPPRITILHPPAARAGEGFNLQPDGMSAIAVQCENAGMFTALRFGDAMLRTTFGDAGLVSALIPPELVSTPGQVGVSLVDAIRGSSDAVAFQVEA